MQCRLFLEYRIHFSLTGGENKGSVEECGFRYKSGLCGCVHLLKTVVQGFFVLFFTSAEGAGRCHCEATLDNL